MLNRLTTTGVGRIYEHIQQLAGTVRRHETDSRLASPVSV